MRLFRAVAVQDITLDVVTNATVAAPIGDTVLALLDSAGNFIADCDDDSPSHGNYSRIGIALPRADYLVAVVGAPGRSGGFQIAGACSSFQPTGTAGFGSNVLSIGPASAMCTYVMDNGTPVDVRFRASEFFYTVIGSDGRVAGVLPGRPNYIQCARLPAGRNVIVGFDRYDYAGPLALEIEGALAEEGHRLGTVGKEGDFTALWISLGPPVPGVSLSNDIRGLVCLPLSAALPWGLQQFSVSGRVDWFPAPTVHYGVTLQAVDLHTGAFWQPGFVATLRNVLQY